MNMQEYCATCKSCFKVQTACTIQMKRMEQNIYSLEQSCKEYVCLLTCSWKWKVTNNCFFFRISKRVKVFTQTKPNLKGQNWGCSFRMNVNLFTSHIQLWIWKKKRFWYLCKIFVGRTLHTFLRFAFMHMLTIFISFPDDIILINFHWIQNRFSNFHLFPKR